MHGRAARLEAGGQQGAQCGHVDARRLGHDGEVVVLVEHGQLVRGCGERAATRAWGRARFHACDHADLGVGSRHVHRAANLTVHQHEPAAACFLGCRGIGGAEVA